MILALRTYQIYSWNPYNFFCVSRIAHLPVHTKKKYQTENYYCQAGGVGEGACLKRERIKTTVDRWMWIGCVFKDDACLV